VSVICSNWKQGIRNNYFNGLMLIYILVYAYNTQNCEVEAFA
jgi:hypothetical protein